jgi:CcmD family protein
LKSYLWLKGGDFFMDAAQYLLVANAAVWIGLGGYIFFLARRQAWLEQRLEHLEAVDNEQRDNASI